MPDRAPQLELCEKKLEVATQMVLNKGELQQRLEQVEEDHEGRDPDTVVVTPMFKAEPDINEDAFTEAPLSLHTRSRMRTNSILQKMTIFGTDITHKYWSVFCT